MVVIEVRPFDRYEIKKQAPKAEFDDESYQGESIDETMSSSKSIVGPETDWNRIGIAGLIWFLSAVENTVVGMSEWPYMHQVDPVATTTFFGFVSSSSRAGHAIFALIFAYWGYKLKHCKLPLLVGRILALCGCALYLCVEFLPENRRYLMLVCYFLFGVGYSSTTVLRGYIAEFSHPKDRSRAYAVSTVAHLIAIVLGPLIQLCFAGIKYPGYEIIPGKLRFNIYSAPIWCALATNAIAIIAVLCCFRDKSVMQRGKDLSTESIISRVLAFVRRGDLLWPLILLCWFQKMMSHLSIVTLMTTGSPLSMIAFGWDGQKTVFIMSISQGIVGLLSVLVSCIYVFGKLGHYVSARFSFLVGLLFSMLLYVLTYPWPLFSSTIPEYDAATGSGCNRTEFDWCNNGTTSPYIWLPIVVLVMGVGLPFSIISIDTIYSKVLGNIDQNMMQGVLIVVEDLMMVVGPVYAAALFSISGQTWLWVTNGIVTAFSILVWLAFYPALAPYK